MPVCQPGDFWADCAKKVKEAIETAETPQQAIQFAIEWNQRFSALVAAYPEDDWTADDQQRFEDAFNDKIQEQIDKVNPLKVIEDALFEQLFPRVAAILEWASGPVATAISTLIAPSPIANPVQEAKPYNSEIQAALRQKLPVLPVLDQPVYDRLVNDAYEAVHGHPLP